jgi:hypothetical protein
MIFVLRGCHFVRQLYISMMLSHLSFARFLLIGAAILAAGGLMLWWLLPVRMAFPPFLLTAVLAGAYGGYEWRRERTKKGDDGRP